jgi:hypothetical protein
MSSEPIGRIVQHFMGELYALWCVSTVGNESDACPEQQTHSVVRQARVESDPYTTGLLTDLKKGPVVNSPLCLSQIGRNQIGSDYLV